MSLRSAFYNIPNCDKIFSALINWHHHNKELIRHAKFQWFSPTEFGTYWSVLSTSMNVACSAGPIVATFIIAALGWRYLFNLFGKLFVMYSLLFKYLFTEV